MARFSKSFIEGARDAAPLAPSFFFIFMGFGMMAAVAGMSPAAAMAMTVMVYAAPAQYAMVDMALSTPAGVAQLAIVGALANLRFFVMGLSLSHLLPGMSRGGAMLWGHFVAATPFLLVYLRSRKEPPADLLEYYKGLSLTLPVFAVSGVAAGLLAGGSAPAPLSFGLMLFMPVYFTLLLTSELKWGREAAAVVMGAALTPLAEIAAPGWGLVAGPVLTGFVLSVSGR